MDEVLSRITEVGWGVAPITDRASTFGWVRWAAAAAKAGLKPVFGVELAVVENIEEKKPTFDYWTFIAEGSTGPINRLIGIATEQFRYQPLLTYDQAQSAEGVIRAAGHRAKIDLIRPESGTMMMVGPPSVRGQIRRAREAGLQFVAASDNVFPRIEDRGFYEVLCGRGAQSQSYDQHIQSDDEWRISVANAGLTQDEIEGALATRAEVWSRSSAGLRVAKLDQPPRPKSLREQCIDGAQKLGCDLTRPEYAARLDRELALIAEKQFEDYFYLVGELCRWARGVMAVGPARGASCGSLVCYLLEITTVDPIPFGLIFERFIDINRADLPDIDIDFSDQQRHLVFDHMKQIYGSERVARLGTVAMFKARSALQEAGAALKVPRWKCDAVADGLVERSSGDSRVNDTLEDALHTTAAGKEVLAGWPEIMVAARMEGHPRHYSQHAAGVVVAAEPIDEVVAVDHRTGATMCDKKDAEGALGLLKIDALGLTQLSVIEDCLQAAGMTMDQLQKAPLDDRGAFDVLNRGEFAGIFQWNGNALKALTAQIKVDRFDDFAAISALARPGPLATGGATKWINRRMSDGEIPPGIHPLLDELTADTYGVIIYQEQVMRITRELGNFSWADTSSIRKLMSSRQGNEKFALFEAQFISGAAENGISGEQAKEIWDQINTFGSWAFNKSHAVAYGMVSYWCCWLKAHFPFEFAAATLPHESDPTKKIELLREMDREGYGYVPVDLQLSTDRWTAGHQDGKRLLVGPLQSVKGMGPKLVQQVLGARARGEPVPARALKLFASPTTDIDTLWPVRDAIARLMPDPSDRNILTRPPPIGEIGPELDGKELMVFCTPVKINPRDENEETNSNKRIERGGPALIEDGKTSFLQLRLMDDTGMIMGKINRFEFGRIGQEVIDRGRPGKSLWAFKGKLFVVGDGFKVLSIKRTRYIGDIEG